MDERPLGVTIIALADSVLGFLIFILGILCWAITSANIELFELVRSIIPSYLLYDVQFYWVSMAIGLSLIAGALGLAKMGAWGYFMVLLNRFLLIILCITYLKIGMPYLIVCFAIPTILIVTYLFRAREFFFEIELPRIQPNKEEIDVPELPPNLVKPSEKAIRAEEIRKVLSTQRSTPKTCPNCGGENSLDAVVCYHCGTYLMRTSQEVSGSPMSEVPQLGKKTVGVSQTSIVFCIYCGTKNPSKAEYCFRCGKKMWRG